MGPTTSNQCQRLNEPEVEFFINNKLFKVPATLPVGTSLAKFIREHAFLFGTKVMCNEGGCGVCIVKVQCIDPVTQNPVVFSVNSCLVPVLACQGWSVTTVEGLGNKSTGYDDVQLRLAQYNGTQCGFCSPGMVMSMSSLLDGSKTVKVEDVEKYFDGNLCRCTGYRSIMAAFKSLAEGGSMGDANSYCDIEDLHQSCALRNKTSNTTIPENDKELSKLVKQMRDIKVDVSLPSQLLNIKQIDVNWFTVTKKQDIFDIWDHIGDESYVLVAGNTSKGVYGSVQVSNYIHLSNVPELKGYSVSDTALTVGANITLAQLIEVLRTVATNQAAVFDYLNQLANHVQLVANTSVRNVATVAGNLCIKHQHPEFPSDFFVLLETVGASLTLEKRNGSVIVQPSEFLNKDLSKTLLTHISFPALDSKLHYLETYKIMPRARSSHAYVNAGFLLKVDKANGFVINGKPNLVYGGVAPSFIHASTTEQFIAEQGEEGKSLLDESVLTPTLEKLLHEILASYVLPETNPEYREELATSLFYKCVLSMSPESLNPKYVSGGQLLKRPDVSTSVIDFNTDKSVWPVNKPISKLEALFQTSGEAQFIYDIPYLPNELHGALVLTTVATGTIEAINTSEALALPGVVAFFSASDVPGKNTFTPVSDYVPEEEVLFCDGNVLYYGQPIGIIVALSHRTALEAVKKVLITYTEGAVPPVLDVKEVIRRGDDSRIFLQAEIKPTMGTVERTESEANPPIITISSNVDLSGQYHFTMELQTCLCVPVEDGLDVYSSTQWMQHVQDAISTVLNLPSHSINMKIRRIGGGYGAKLTRSSMVAAACAVASHLLNKPVRLVLDLKTNMSALGKRYPCFTKYQAKVHAKTGRIVELEAKLYEDAGCSLNDPVVETTLMYMQHTYNSECWSVKGYAVKTDLPSNTWCRSPSSTEGIATIEGIIEGIATALSLDPISVRMANMKAEHTQLLNMVEYWKSHIDYDSRLSAIEAFNEENWWKQKGISLVPMAYALNYASNYNATVSIYAFDGSVAVTHGGIECGQGINTKVAQVCAYILGIDMSYIQIKPTDNLTSPNNQGTGGSVASESAAYAVRKCCLELLERLKPIRHLVSNSNDWPELIKMAYSKDIKLSASYMFTVKDNVKDYTIYGVTAVEVEVDTLTGQHLVTRADILEDAGVSLSPQVDIGQIEGAFIMGLGYYTTEQLIYDTTGQLKTNRTWNYFIPGPNDIPVDFRVEIQKHSVNPHGVLRSKATGEPPLCMSVSIVLAIHKALAKMRLRNGAARRINLYAPMTPEKIFIACYNDIKHYKLTST